MGLDGLSQRNFGIYGDKISSTISQEAFELAKKNSEIIIKNVEESEKKRSVKRKSFEDEKQEKKLHLSYEYIDEDENELQNDELEQFFEENTSIDCGEEKKFNVKLNDKLGVVEIYDQNEVLVETMDVEDLSELLKKLKTSPSVFVNKKV